MWPIVSMVFIILQIVIEVNEQKVFKSIENKSIHLRHSKANEKEGIFPSIYFRKQFFSLICA
ncbi:hypothetical protein, partial [Acinetobacter baumannii]|uniref:hypothetical protein n=1 Tax=Acinetobacter baumannii TaxID=470 RepID=UPI001C06C927